MLSVASSWMSVLAVAPSASAEESMLFLDSVRRFQTAGRTVTAVLPGDGTLRTALESVSVTTELYPPAGRRRGAVTALATLLSLRRFVDAEQPAFVYVAGSPPSHPRWILASVLARRPCICHLRASDLPRSRAARVLRLLPLVLAQRVVVDSDATAAAILRSAPWLRRRVMVDPLAGS